MYTIYIGTHLDNCKPKTKDDLINVGWRRCNHYPEKWEIDKLLSNYSKAHDCHVYSCWRVAHFIEKD